MKIDFDIKDKVAVITGGAGILCAEMAKGLAAHGARIALLDLMEDKAREVAEDIKHSGGNAIALGCDVLNKESIQSAAQAVLDQYGTVDILINGAGGNKADATTGGDKAFFDVPEEAVKWVFNLNLMGTILPTQVFGKIFAERKAGCVVNISSMAAFTPLTRTLAYSAAKAGVINLTQSVASEYGKHGIRCNAVLPGSVRTENVSWEIRIKKDPDVFKKLARWYPLGRVAEPEDVAKAVSFLASDDAGYITGVTLPVDGGLLAGMNVMIDEFILESK